MNIQSITEARNKALHDLGVIAKKDSMTSEDRSAFDRLSQMVEDLSGDLQRAERAAELDAESRSQNRPPRAVPASSEPNNAEAEQRAFRQYITKGKVSAENRAYLREERDVMGTGNTGVVLPTSFDPLLQSAIKDYGEASQFVRTLRTSSGEGLKVADADPSSLFFSVLDEGDATTPVNIPTSGKTVNTDTLTFATTVQNQLLQDAYFDLNGFISETFGQVYAQTIAKFITLGNSSNFDSLTASAVTKVTSAGSPTFENLVDLYASIDYSQLNNGAKFLMSQQVWASLMKLKDGDGRYILTPNAQGVPYSSLFGIDIVRSAFSPNTTTVGNKAIILANPKAYTWRQVGNLSIIRLDQIGALSLQTTFLGVARGAGYHRIQSSNPSAVALAIGAAS